MERQMHTAERLSALGTLAAAMAHEIRNPLEALDLNLALLERSMAALKLEAPEDDKTGKYVRSSNRRSSRLAAIVENFLSFARPSSASSTEIRLDAMLRQIVDLLYNQARSREVKLELSTEGNPIVFGSEDQLKQAILNLLINSLEAMPNGGSLRITAGITRHQGAAGSQDLAVVRIQDTGVGIPQDQMARLFDPFFTTRPKGTGLGLTIVHRVIHEHKGSIRVASIPGEGTTFTIELPLHVPSGKSRGNLPCLKLRQKFWSWMMKSTFARPWQPFSEMKATK